MVQPSSSFSGSESKRKSRARELLDWAREEEYDDGLRALVQSPIDDLDNPSPSTYTSPPSQAKPKANRMEKEMDELERWLEEDESQRVNEDPWACRDEFGSPLSTESRLGARTPTTATFFGSGAGSGGEGGGFEDDFTDFVGAPMDHEPRRSDSNSTKGRSFSYMSLHSEFDILEDEDADLPSQDEIQATTHQIFGSTSSNLPIPTSGSKQQQFLSATDAPGLGVSPAPSTSTLGDEDDFGLSRFDLSRVFSSLQVMKEEISEMTDDRERRRTAARVALGLVYGLQRDEDTDVQ
jgi:hypothetical protein